MACPVLDPDRTDKIEHIRRSVPVDELRNESRRRALYACQEAYSQARAAGEDIADAFAKLEQHLASKLRGEIA